MGRKCPSARKSAAVGNALLAAQLVFYLTEGVAHVLDLERREGAAPGIGQFLQDLSPRSSVVAGAGADG